MMILYWILGSILIIGITLDLIITTLESSGTGFISGPLTTGIWTMLRKLFCKSMPAILNYSGLIVTMTLFGFWVMGLWCGFFLLYMTDFNSIIESTSKDPTDALQKFYYAGYCLFTLGNGDLAPNKDLYRIITTLNAVTGLVFITLTITYLIPTLSAVSFKRQLSVLIGNLGSSPVEILKNGWDGKQFKHLEPILEELNSMILMNSEKHLTYPVLHFFHRNEKKYSTPLSLAKLDEAMTIALNHFPRETLSNPLLFQSVKKGLEEYCDTLHTIFIDPAEETPPADYEQELKEQFPGVEIKWDPAPFHTQKKRKIMLKLVQNDCWNWKDVKDK